MRFRRRSHNINQDLIFTCQTCNINSNRIDWQIGNFLCVSLSMCVCVCVCATFWGTRKSGGSSCSQSPSWVIAATQSLVININWAWKSKWVCPLSLPLSLSLENDWEWKPQEIDSNKDELQCDRDEKIDRQSFWHIPTWSGLWHPIKKRNWVTSMTGDSSSCLPQTETARVRGREREGTVVFYFQLLPFSCHKQKKKVTCLSPRSVERLSFRFFWRANSLKSNLWS